MSVLLRDKDFLIWEVTESLPELLSCIPAFIPRPSYKAESRMLEWAAVHVALKALTGEWQLILHYSNGAPYLANDNRCLSVSHTRGVVAVSLSSYPCGIDVEYLADRALKLRDRFLSHAECAINLMDKSLESTLLWSAKEAVFKVHPQQEAIDFKFHLHAQPFTFGNLGTFKVQETKTPYQKWYEVSYRIFDTFVFTRAIPLD